MKPAYERIVNPAVNAAVRALGPNATEEEIDGWIAANRSFPRWVEEALVEDEVDYQDWVLMIEHALDVARARNPSGLFLVFRVEAES